MSASNIAILPNSSAIVCMISSSALTHFAHILPFFGLEVKLVGVLLLGGWLGATSSKSLNPWFWLSRSTIAIVGGCSTHVPRLLELCKPVFAKDSVA